MSRFTRAVRECASILNGGSASPSEWLHVVRQCDLLLAGTDQPIRSAVALGRLVVPEPKKNRRTTLARIGLQHDPWEPVSQREHEELRAVALYVTHAATRDAEGPPRLLLAGIERSMLGAAAPPRSFEAALRGWGHALAAAVDVVDPAGALLVSKIQYSLLTGGTNLLKEFEVTDGGGHDRLVIALEASRQEWARAYSNWRGLVPRNTRSASDLQPAISALQLAAQNTDSRERLRALLATGLGGNLTAALAVTPADMRAESALVRSALVLEPRSDLASTLQPREMPAVPDSVGAAPAVGVGRAVQFSADTAPTEPSGARYVKAVAVESVEMGDVEVLAGLARQRDAGQLAEAALAGVGEAAALVGDASREELTRLVERGEEACGSLAVHALPIVHHFTAKVHPNERHEFVSVASEQLLELAKVWDPPQSKWSTFAYRAVGFTAKSANRHFKQWREVVSDQAVGLASQHRVVGSAPRSVEDQVTDAEERALVESWISRLPDRLRVVAERRLDDMKGPSTLIEIGARIGRSESTVHRLEADAYRLLRGYHAESQAEPRPTAVSLRQLAQALRPPAQAGVSTVDQRKWGPPASQSRPPAR